MTKHEEYLVNVIRQIDLLIRPAVGEVEIVSDIAKPIYRTYYKIRDALLYIEREIEND